METFVIDKMPFAIRKMTKMYLSYMQYKILQETREYCELELSSSVQIELERII